MERLDGIVKTVDHLLKESGVVRQAGIIPVADLEQAVRDSDVILTATPARRPYIRGEWVRPGTHLSCVGADMAGKPYVMEAVLRQTAVYVNAECLS